MSASDKNLLGILLLGVLITIYSYYNFEDYSENELKKIEGTLAEMPYYGSQGGDFKYYFIRLRLNEYKYKFYLRSYAYNTLNLDLFKRLEPGDSLKLGIKLDGDDAGELNVYDVYSVKYGYLLRFEDFNENSRNGWRFPFYLTIIVLTIFITRLGINHFSSNN